MAIEDVELINRYLAAFKKANGPDVEAPSVTFQKGSFVLAYKDGQRFTVPRPRFQAMLVNLSLGRDHVA